VLPLVVIAPDIDLAGGISIDRRCADWIERAGGATRVAEPDASEPLRGAGGLLLCGGFFDIPPDWYGETPVARVDAPREVRSRFELDLAREAERLGLALLGVCGGEQLMAVARGGSLIQDIGSQIPGALEHERSAESDRVVHAVRLEPASGLRRILGVDEIEVNSTHHQSVRDPGRGARIAAKAPDGVVEAIEDPALEFWIGVQWHPERLADAHSLRLAEAFVRAAGAAGAVESA